VKVLGPSVEQVTGALAWAATRVKLTRVGDPDGTLIRFAGSSPRPSTRTVEHTSNEPRVTSNE
jgi:hypothetical protein